MKESTSGRLLVADSTDFIHVQHSSRRRQRHKGFLSGAMSNGSRGGNSSDGVFRAVNRLTTIGAVLPLLLVTFRGVKCYFQRSVTSSGPRLSLASLYATRTSRGSGSVALISMNHHRPERHSRNSDTSSSLRLLDQTLKASRTRLLSTAAPPSGSEVSAGLEGRSERNGANIYGKSKKQSVPPLVEDPEWQTGVPSSFGKSNEKIDADAAANFLYNMMVLGHAEINSNSNERNGNAASTDLEPPSRTTSSKQPSQKSTRRNRKTITRVSRNSRLSTKAAKSTSSRSQPVAPLTSSSKKKQMDTANAILEGKFLTQRPSDPTEFSLYDGEAELPPSPVNKDGIFYDENGVLHTASKPRRKGRPASVAGAMSKATVARLNRLQSARLSAEQNSVLDMDSAAAFVARVRGLDNVTEAEAELPNAPVTEKGTKTKITPIASVNMEKRRAQIWKEEVDESLLEDKLQPVRRRRRQKSKTDAAADFASSPNSKSAEDEIADYAKNYYRTDLLTRDEEYALGIKVQFMMRAEHIHEGICARLGRFPTIKEWAHACGFVEEAHDTKYEKYEEELRPTQSETLLTVKDPSMFVGKSTLELAGPGRGRGRPRQPPPALLSDYFDDSALKAALAARKRARGKRKKKNSMSGGSDDGPDDALLKELRSIAATPINRGTPHDFVDMLMASREAKRRMIKCNMRLVVSIARRYNGKDLSVADVIQEGSLGLARAAEKYEPQRGFRFSTYASWWIQQSILKAIANSSRTIRLPLHVHHLLNRIRRIRRILEQELGRQPNTDEVAAELGMSGAKCRKMINLTRRCISLELPKYRNNHKALGSSKKVTIGDTIDSKHAFDEVKQEKRLDQGFLQEDLKEMLKILSDDERDVLTWRYGLSDGVTRTVSDVALKMRQNKGWVRSNESRALRKLRRPWYEKKLAEHAEEMNYSRDNN